MMHLLWRALQQIQELKTVTTEQRMEPITKSPVTTAEFTFLWPNLSALKSPSLSLSGSFVQVSLKSVYHKLSQIVIKFVSALIHPRFPRKRNRAKL